MKLSKTLIESPKKSYKSQKAAHAKKTSGKKINTCEQNVVDSVLLFKQKCSHGKDIPSAFWLPSFKCLIFERLIWKSICEPRRMTGQGSSVEFLYNDSTAYTTCGSLNLETTDSMAFVYVFSTSERYGRSNDINTHLTYLIKATKVMERNNFKTAKQVSGRNICRIVCTQNTARWVLFSFHQGKLIDKPFDQLVPLVEIQTILNKLPLS